MRREVGDRHLARQYEGDRAYPEAEQGEEPTDDLDDGGDAELGSERHGSHRPFRDGKKLLGAVGDEEQRDDDAKDALEVGRPVGGYRSVQGGDLLFDAVPTFPMYLGGGLCAPDRADPWIRPSPRSGPRRRRRRQ